MENLLSLPFLKAIQNKELSRVFNTLGPHSLAVGAFSLGGKRQLLERFESTEKLLSSKVHEIGFEKEKHLDSNDDYVQSPYTVRYQEICLQNNEEPESERVIAFEDSKLSDLAYHPITRQIAEQISDKVVEREPKTVLLSMYKHGDYVGLHSDAKWIAHLYKSKQSNSINSIDVHFSVSNAYVEHQALLFQVGPHLVTRGYRTADASLSVLQLPFFHQVTPLQGIFGQEDKARRWLLAVSFMEKS